jgi:cell division protein FtsW
LQQTWRGFLKPMGVVGLLGVLMLLEPDFGSTVVLAATVVAMLFVAGIKLGHFFLLVLAAVGSLGAVAVLSPYRMQRLITFLDPWSDMFNSGYQLTQSLIAFGRGQWTGMGLGHSIQKLLYLPEAHTDFIYAVIAEEFGLIGGLMVMGLLGTLIYRLVMMAREAIAKQQLFSGLVVFGVAMMFACQTLINIGVASGFLPTKGLTLPFISYGGSSLLVSCALMMLVMRVYWELSVVPMPARAATRAEPRPESVAPPRAPRVDPAATARSTRRPGVIHV